jgi:serine/threonine-protein kinase PknK
LNGIGPTTRPLAALQAHLLFAETLTATGRVNDVRNHIAEARALCAQHGLPQLLIDAGLD